jgi:L-rhamnose mutarotase
MTGTGQVIGYLECDDFDEILRAMESTDVNARWQDEMAEFFEGLDGKRADEGLTLLSEIFHLD